MLGLDNPIHILFLLVIVLLVFGAKRLPEMGKSLGEGLRGFKDSVSGDSSIGHMTTEHMSAPTAPQGDRLSAAAAPRVTEPAERVTEPHEQTPVTPGA